MIKISQNCQEVLRNYLPKLREDNFAKRLWAKDASLWKSEPEHRKTIENSLGWLFAPKNTLSQIDEIKQFVNKIKKDFTHCVLLGMGGSSLAPEVFSKIFPKNPGYPNLLILDSTNPDQISQINAQIVLEKTLFVFSSKSGGTIEPNSFFKYYYDCLSKIKKNPGDNFIAITDPGTSLDKLAQKKKFKKIFQNQADIGGRFSVLSHFGIVPAAIMGIDIEKFLNKAVSTSKECSESVDAKDNPGVVLGTLMGGFALNGKDKLTVLLPDSLKSFGLWIDQLVAESTGKEGKGIIPVTGEENLDFYSDDRLFVNFETEKSPNEKPKKFCKELQEKGHPIVTLQFNDEYSLAAQFFVWEIATATAGKLLSINPFDQPNVQETKTNTLKILENAKEMDNIPDTAEIQLSNSLKKKTMNIPADSTVMRNIVLNGSKDKECIALLAYLSENEQTNAHMNELRNILSKLTKLPVTFGYGPRYLHSTGQLHKGGKNSIFFLMITSASETTLKIPDEKYTFNVLCQAQADGDFSALSSKDRNVLKISLPSVKTLSHLKDIIG
jgi:glucose-6-phosphate isomerase